MFGKPTLRHGFAVLFIACISAVPKGADAATTLTMSPAANSALSGATIGLSYSQTFTISGTGTAPFFCALSSNTGYTSPFNTLPAGLTLSPTTSATAGAGNTTCTISGTPTGQAGTYGFKIQGKDSAATANTSSNGAYTITVVAAGAPLSMLPASGTALTAGKAGTAYTNAQITGSGGTAPYTCALANGTTVPGGLTLNSNCSITGTPSASASGSFQVTLTDSASPQASLTQTYSLTVNPSGSNKNIGVPENVGGATATTLALTMNCNPSCTSVSIATSSTGTGATSSGSLILTRGTMSVSGGVVTYLPSQLGTSYGASAGPYADTAYYSVTDSNGTSTWSTINIYIQPATLSVSPSTLPVGSVGAAYSQEIAATGGYGSNTCALTIGTLPSGLSFTGCTIAGTPSATGTANITVTVTDGSSPAATKAQAYTLTINPAAPVAGAVSATTNENTGGASASAITLNLSGGAAASVAIDTQATNGTATASGTGITYLPNAGFNGTDTFTYTATNVTGTSAPATVTVTVSAPTLSVSPASLPAGTVGTAYSQAITATGGYGSNTCAVTTGSLPAGLALTGCTIAGTPSATGTANIAITVTDGSSPGVSKVQAYTLAVSPAMPVAGAVNTTINENLGSATASAITLNLSGGAAASVAVIGNPSNGIATVSGTGITYLPNAGFNGTDSINYTVTNATGTSAPATVTITVNAPTLSVSPASLPIGVVGTVYSQTITATGGYGSYICGTTDTLPTGLTLTGCTIGGTPSVAISTNVTITVSDSSSPNVTKAQTYTLAVSPALPIAGAVSATVAENLGSGATATASAITLNLSGGAAASVSIGTQATNGTATASGTGITYLPNAGFNGSDSFTYTVTNPTGTSAAATVNITITAPTLHVNPNSLPQAVVGTAYSQTITATGGYGSNTCAVTAGTLPAGLALTGCTIGGTPSAAGSENITITVTDGSSPSVAKAQAYTLTVVASLPAPVAGAASATINENLGSASASAIALNLSGGTAASVAIGTQATNGTATASGTGITYLPNAGFNGTDTFTYTATNATGTSAAATVTVTVSALTLSVSPSSLPVGTVGTAYSQAITATGGYGSNNCAVTTGTLPAGLTLTGCTIAGTPSATGTANITVTVTDSSSPSVSKAQAYTLAVSPAMPVAGAVSATINENLGSASASAITLNLSGGAAASVAVGTQATKGVATASGTGITYLPNAGFNGTDTFTYTATNATGTSAAATVTVTVSALTLSVSPSSLPVGTVGTAYSQAITATGGYGSNNCAVTTGTLPAGLTLTGCTIAGTPSAAGTASITITVTDGSSPGVAKAQAYTLTVIPNVPAPVAGPVSATINENLGSATASAITLNLSGGAAASVAIGTPATKGVATASGTGITYLPNVGFNGTDTFTYTATNVTGTSGVGTVTVTVSPATLTASPVSLPVAIAGTTYSQAITATGGYGSTTCAVTSGTLPSGLTLTGCTIGGTPTVVTSANITITLTDSSTPVVSKAQAYTLTVNPPPPVVGAVSGTVSENLGSGATATPISVLLNLGGGAAASVAIGTQATKGVATASGTSITYLPSPGFNGMDTFTYTATNVTGTSAPAPVTINITPTKLSVSPASLPAGTVGAAYSQTITSTGGYGSTSCALGGGTLPAGLTLNGCTISGTPSASATANITITVSDSSSPVVTKAQAYTLAVSPALPVAGAVSATVAENIGSGATATSSAITLNLSGGVASSVAIGTQPTKGVATVSGMGITYLPNAGFNGTDSFTYTATNVTGTSAPATVTITVSAPTLNLSPTSLGAGAGAGVAYSQIITASGGYGSYTCALSGGALPVGITLSGCTLSGTPTTTGSSNFTLKVTDGSTPAASNTQTYTLTVNAIAPPVANPVTLPAGNSGTSGGGGSSGGGGTPNNSTTIVPNISGGAPTSLAVVAQPAHGTVTVATQAVTAGYFNGHAATTRLVFVYTPDPQYLGLDGFSYTATNAAGTSAVAQVSLKVVPALTAQVVVASQTATEGTALTPFIPVKGVGGAGALSYSISPSLSAGLTIDQNTGSIAGTPTAGWGSTGYTVTITDPAGQVASGSFTLTVSALQNTLAITPDTLPAVRAKVSYSQTLSAANGIAPYTWSVASGTLPSGLTLSASGLLSGSPAATATFTVLATDSVGHTGRKTYTLTVNARPDPVQDRTVRALLTGQAQMTQQFAQAQMSNIASHLQSLHGEFDACNSGRIQLTENSAASQNPNLAAMRKFESGAEGKKAAQTPHREDEEAAKSEQAKSSDTADTGAKSCLAKRLFGNVPVGLWVGGGIEHGAPVDVDRFTTRGVTLGLEGRLSTRFAGGLALGLGDDLAGLDKLGSRIDGTSHSVSAYATYRLSGMTFDAILGSSTNSLDNRRWVALDGAFVTGKRSSSSTFGSLAASMRFNRGALSVEPQIGIDYIDSALKGYAEGAERTPTTLALTFNGTSVRAFSALAGVLGQYDIRLSDGGLVTPLLKAEYRRIYDRSQSQTMFYNDVPDLSYTATGFGFPNDLWQGEAGLRVGSNKGLRSELSLGYQRGNTGYSSTSVNARLSLPIGASR
jgi:hypothetical protein